jgi:hypothetical protein
MIDANTLLDPSLQDRQIRAYAYLSTQYKKGVRSPIDCLQPFVVYAISEHFGQQLDWQKIRGTLIENYNLRIPYYMLQRMQGELEIIGAIEKTAVAGLFTCGDARPILSSKQVDFSISDIDRVGRGLAKYANGRGYPSPLTASVWTDVLVPFFIHRAPPEDKAVAVVKNVLISDPKLFDFTIVAEFIREQFDASSDLYKVIEQVYYGALVADFLTQIERTGDKKSFRDLSIVYDGPVILRLLGCSGRILRSATVELHDTLRELGCRTYYFHHTYDEVLASIEAILRGYESGNSIFKETQEAISRGETTITEIYAIRAELDLRLASLGITEHSVNYSLRSQDTFQIDEGAFKDKLGQGKTWGPQGSLAAERDAMSLALLMRLRNGKHVRDVSKANFVFVTHNVRLSVVAKDFLRDERELPDGSVWPFMTVGQLSTIAWVVNEVFLDETKISKDLIANCYMAALPDQDFDERLKEAFSKVDPEQAKEIYGNAFVVQSIRQIAMSQTAGHSALIKTLNTAELLAEAESVRNEELQKARREERDLAAGEVRGEQEERLLRNARTIAEKIGRIIMGLIFVAGAVGAALSSGLLDATAIPNSKGPMAVSLAISIYGLLDTLGIGRIPSLRKVLEGLVFRAVRRLQRALT